MEDKDFSGMKSDTGFFVAFFTPDGTLEGVSHWRFDQLSSKWLRICREFLEHHGSAFEAPWRGPLSHIHTHFASDDGAALVTLQANGKPAAGVALLSGVNPVADSSVEKMFVDFLRRVDLFAAASQSPALFQEIFALKERPLMIVVPWGHPEISDQDYELTSELTMHIAAAFFEKTSGWVGQ